MSTSVGICLWCLKPDPPFEKAIERAAALGFTAVELGHWDSDAVWRGFAGDALPVIQRALADNGLTVCAFDFAPVGLASSDAATRRRAVEQVARVAEIAVSLGAPILAGLAPAPFEMPVPLLTDLPLSQALSVGAPRHKTSEWNEKLARVHRVGGVGC